MSEGQNGVKGGGATGNVTSPGARPNGNQSFLYSTSNNSLVQQQQQRDKQRQQPPPTLPKYTSSFGSAALANAASGNNAAAAAAAANGQGRETGSYRLASLDRLALRQRILQDEKPTNGQIDNSVKILMERNCCCYFYYCFVLPAFFLK